MGVLGLLHCAHTPVGGPLARGVSGGERRRVAAAEVLVGPQSVVLADQISTGLDSATTFTVVKFMGEAVRAMRKTCVVSLLQPPPEVMALFDDVILLTEGRVIYQ
jgi:ABC-type multidrug transport system ATPase subunit